MALEHFYRSEDYKLENFQNLILQYKLNPNKAFLDDMRMKASLYIRFYPSFAFRVFDEDVLSDFYTIAFSKLDSIIQSYDPNKKVMFKTYLSQSLRNLWINFKLEKKKRPKEIVGLKLDAPSREQESEAIWKGDFIQDFFEREKDDFKYLTIKLYYHDFFDEKDFIRLAKFNEKSYGVCMALFKNLLDEVAKKRARKNWYELMLARMQITILNNSKDMEEKKRERLQEISRRYLKSYRGVQEYPSFQVIADFFDCSPIKISNVVHYFKKQVKKNMSIQEYIQ